MGRNNLLSYDSNIITLVRLGFLPPKFEKKDLEKTLIYLFWDVFKVNCAFAEFKEFIPPKIYCNKKAMPCDFNICPILRDALKKYERKSH